MDTAGSGLVVATHTCTPKQSAELSGLRLLPEPYRAWPLLAATGCGRGTPWEITCRDFLLINGAVASLYRTGKPP